MAIVDASAGAFAAEVAIKVSAVLVLAWGATALMGRLPAALRHMVWAGALAMALVLPGMIWMGLGWRVVPWGDRAARPVVGAVDLSIPVRGSGDGGLVRSDVAGAHDMGLSRHEVADGGLSMHEMARTGDGGLSMPTRASAPLSVGEWLGVIWLFGLVVMVGRMVLGSLYLRGIERGGRPAGAEWDAMLEEVRGVYGVRRKVTLLVSERVGMPLTFGVRRPRIVVPAGAMGWGAERRRVVLLHEMAHVARLDVVAQVVALWTRALYWVHPLVWVAVWKLETERERACDDCVVRLGTAATDYAQSLLDIARGAIRRTTMSAAVMGAAGLGMARQSTLERRVRRVLAGRPGGAGGVMTRRMAWGAAGMVVVLGGALGMLRAADGPAAGAAGATTSSAATSAPAVTKADEHFVAAFGGGGKVEVVAVGAVTSEPWWTPVGGPAVVDGVVNTRGFDTGSTSEMRRFVLKVTDAAGGAATLVVQVNGEVRPMGAVVDRATGHPIAGLRSAWGMYPAGVRVGTLRVGVAMGAWKTQAKTEWEQSGKTAEGEFSIGRPGGYLEKMPGGAADRVSCDVKMAHTLDVTKLDLQLVAVDQSGAKTAGKVVEEMGAMGELRQDMWRFEGLDADNVKSLELETRPMVWVEFDNVALEPKGKRAEAAGDGNVRENKAAALNNVAGTVTTAPAGERSREQNTEDLIKLRDTLKTRLAEMVRGATKDGVYQPTPGIAVVNARIDAVQTELDKRTDALIALARVANPNAVILAQATGEYYVMGTPRPGVYTLGGRKISLLQALAAAGYSDLSDVMAVVQLTHRVDDTHSTKSYFMVQALLAQTENVTYLQPNDILVVKEDVEYVTYLVSRDDLRKDLKDREAALAEAEREYGEQHPTVREAKSQLDAVRGKLAEVEKKLADYEKKQ